WFRLIDGDRRELLRLPRIFLSRFAHFGAADPLRIGGGGNDLSKNANPRRRVQGAISCMPPGLIRMIQPSHTAALCGRWPGSPSPGTSSPRFPRCTEAAMATAVGP